MWRSRKVVIWIISIIYTNETLLFFQKYMYFYFNGILSVTLITAEHHVPYHLCIFFKNTYTYN